MYSFVFVFLVFFVAMPRSVLRLLCFLWRPGDRFDPRFKLSPTVAALLNVHGRGGDNQRG
jgi:hypothetical protein